MAAKGHTGTHTGRQSAQYEEYVNRHKLNEKPDGTFVPGWSGRGTHVVFENQKKMRSVVLKADKPVLGRGWFGSVRVVRLRTSIADQEVKVARKKISLRNRETGEEHVSIEDFMHETMINAAFRHKHVTQLVGTYELRSKEYLFLLQYPVADTNLRVFMNDLCQSSNIHHKERAYHLGRFIGCLANAVEYLHDECQVKHLDIKADNILVKRNDRGPAPLFTVLITDFGLTREMTVRMAHCRGEPDPYSSDPSSPALRPMLTPSYLGVPAVASYLSLLPSPGFEPSPVLSEASFSWVPSTREYCGPEIQYSPKPGMAAHTRRSDIFMLGCVFSEIVTVATSTYNLQDFANARRQTGGISSMGIRNHAFAENLSEVREWLEGLQKGWGGNLEKKQDSFESVLHHVHSDTIIDGDLTPSSVNLSPIHRPGTPVGGALPNLNDLDSHDTQSYIEAPSGDEPLLGTSSPRVPPMSAVDVFVWSNRVNVIKRMLNFSPDDRPSARRVVRALDAEECCEETFFDARHFWGDLGEDGEDEGIIMCDKTHKSRT